MSERRALHYVLRIGKRKEAMSFFKNVLGMKVLRHEEFEKGCDAACNGPYDGKWSKTMVGYGPEDDHFVLELTYNYGIGSYRKANELRSIDILKADLKPVLAAGGIMERIKRDGIEEVDACTIDYEDYKFRVFENKTADKIDRVILATTNMARTLEFWNGTLGMSNENDSLSYSPAQCKLQFEIYSLSEADRTEPFGRTAFACPTEQLKPIEELVSNSTDGSKVLTSFLTLPTPGKADVHVVILQDPDGHEICFVGDEGFRDLSQVDPAGDQLLEDAIAADKSDEWFAKKGGKDSK
ncbi:Glyoxalase domain-containing protein 4 [Orchesella cincta]|uniref:Glyoxalase domain-containing protein 4 n=1 Tax=Orchesella cincta TaxID=48709 RepID=A0A1D2NMH7_ORCCI|nr:Glyoxalase domain-containing protein 4 [Orchesella cincta]